MKEKAGNLCQRNCRLHKFLLNKKINFTFYYTKQFEEYKASYFEESKVMVQKYKFQKCPICHQCLPYDAGELTTNPKKGSLLAIRL